MKKKTSIIIMLLCSGVASTIYFALALIVTMIINHKWNSGMSLTQIAFPWYDLIFEIVFFFCVVVSFLVVMLTGPDHTKLKAGVLIALIALAIIGAAAIGNLVPLMIDRKNIAYVTTYARVNSTMSYVRALPSLLQTLLLYFSLGRYFELENTAENE